MTEELLHDLYYDEELGKYISTHSMLKSMRRCPKQFDYKYILRYHPKVLGRPLRLGTWMHKLQEVHYGGGDWREEQKHQRIKFKALFEEEQDVIGNLPSDTDRLMKSYLWHYAKDDWKVLDVEMTIEVELPDGSIFRCKIDLLVEDQYGLWIVDHKWHRTLPSHEYRVLDMQSAFYIWAAIKSGIPVQGHIWNYGRSKAPSIPELTAKTRQVSRWARLDTDYYTAAKWFKANPDTSIAPYRAKLKWLRDQQYEFGKPQHSTYFKRVVIEKSPELINRAARELYHTKKRMDAYPWHQRDIIERVPDRSCLFMCSYTDICSAELQTGGVPVDIKRRFEVKDPMYYYWDDPKDGDGSKD